MKKLKVGVFGAGRGWDLALNFMAFDCDIVALCDTRKEKLEKYAPLLSKGGRVYEDFDQFIQHDMDAIILANDFHQHAPYAIRCMKKGIHVYSECISNGTMAEGVALIRAAEESNAVYMLAENYPQMLFNREIARICKGGTLGKILYAEGEYNHPTARADADFIKITRFHREHWRAYLPATYYITHSLGPIMCATGATPRRVTAFAIFAPNRVGLYNGDNSAIITTQNDDGSVYRMVGCAHFGAHHNSYRVCGENGQVENLRGMGDRIMLRYNSWSCPEGASTTSLYEPVFNDLGANYNPLIGHGGADYLTVRNFLRCIEEGCQPEHPFNVHSAVAMSSVAILGHRSMLEGGIPYDIPDFRQEEWRKKYENDTLSPFPGEDGSAPTLPCCSHPDYRPSDAEMEEYDSIIRS
ncbi:MAG: Gfo/Idh/MocA family oxidoreductase [Christensenellales bacterium]|nr:Gfo/Idh/MocA family oxidoreductase [Christensenellales bacterium]